MKKLFFIISAFLIILLILFFLFYKRIPSAAWKIENPEDILPQSVKSYFVFDDFEKFLKIINSKGLVDTIKNKKVIEELLIYIGIPKRIREQIEKTDLIKLTGKKVCFGFSDKGFIIVLKPERFLLNIFNKLMKFEKEIKDISYTLLNENYGLFLIDEYLIITDGEEILKETAHHLKGKKRFFKKFYKRDFPENSLIYGAYLKDSEIFKSEKTIFYYLENNGLNIIIEKPDGLLGRILKNSEPDLKEILFPVDNILYISLNKFKLKEEIEKFLKEKKEEKLSKFFEKNIYLIKDAGEKISFSFKGILNFSDFSVPIFLIKIENKGNIQKSFENFLKEISKGELDFKEGKIGNIPYKFFINKYGDEFLGFFNYRRDFYISSSLELLREEIHILNEETKKKDFPEMKNLFFYLDGIKLLEFIKEYMYAKIYDTFILENKIIPIINSIEIKEIFGTFEKDGDKILINFK
jgi:hypothetical protein